MIGSIIGDIAGSVYEFNNIKTKDFPLFTDEKAFTDDSVLSIATAQWILDGCKTAASYYADFALHHEYVMGGYETGFQNWIVKAARQGVYSPYNSCGNGSVMRITPVGWAFDTEEEVMEKAKASVECTHNHPGGIAGAQATALGILWGRKGKSKDFIKSEIERRGCHLVTSEVLQHLSLRVSRLWRRAKYCGNHLRIRECIRSLS